MPNIDTGFPYSATPNAHVLVLGSMPSRKSLAEQQYYAHPRNAFWPIMGELFDFDAALPYEQRLHCLCASGVALWDVAHQCIRPGSLDSDIRDVVPNNFTGFFTDCTSIHHIFFNGRKAETMYCHLVLPGLSGPWHDLPQTCLPSTSPAHASRSFAEKLAAWKVVKEVLKQALETDPI
ncbi:MAG: DNA-deoxyinosine glycosylase [Mariprofundaceae bacterium]|nr:DNA-deoxyinosine glycosylase [Mariprofundaceae bacterium]